MYLLLIQGRFYADQYPRSVPLRFTTATCVMFDTNAVAALDYDIN